MIYSSRDSFTTAFLFNHLPSLGAPLANRSVLMRWVSVSMGQEEAVVYKVEVVCLRSVHETNHCSVERKCFVLQINIFLIKNCSDNGS